MIVATHPSRYSSIDPSPSSLVFFLFAAFPLQPRTCHTSAAVIVLAAQVNRVSALGLSEEFLLLNERTTETMILADGGLALHILATTSFHSCHLELPQVVNAATKITGS